MTTTLVSYGGDRRTCELLRPRSTEELAACLRSARDAGRRVSIRGGGQAFDLQSLNDDLVISTEHLRGMWFTPDAGRVQVAAGERWGSVMRAAHQRGRIPAVLVTTEQASVAGTISGNCVSRFSPLYGQEGDHVEGLELVTTDGTHHHLVRPATGSPPSLAGDMFFAVTGGLGYVGAIASAELTLRAATGDQVETRVAAAGAVDEVLAACVPSAAAATAGATRYATLQPDLRRGIVYESRYVSGERPRPFLAVYQPRSFLRLLGEIGLYIPLVNRIGWRLAYWGRRPRYVDPLLDFTFFMDGNSRLRRIGRRLGFAMRIVQQSFVVPVPRAPELVGRARDVFRRRRLWPAMADVLHCLPDEGLLSATYRMSGLFVTFAFQPATGRRLAAIDDALTTVASECRRLGGRVHLTKHVRARRDDLEAMYADTLPRFRAVKEALDPTRTLRNEFFDSRLHALV